VWAAPSFDSEKVGGIDEAVGVLRERRNNFMRVDFGERSGWVTPNSVTEYDPKLTRFVNRAVEQNRSLLIIGQEMQKNRIGSLDLQFVFYNISRQKTVKYVRVTVTLFNSVGDPVKGVSQTTRTARGVGPIKPDKSAAISFDDVWNSDVGSCVVVEEVQVEHMNGGEESFGSDEIAKIVPYKDEVNLKGDCSYEAQQSR
jgi:hypothetical protein